MSENAQPQPEPQPRDRATTRRDRVAYTVELPSRGLLYDGALPDGIVKMMPMTAKEEKLVIGMGQKGRNPELVTTLLEACLLTDTLSVKDYLVTDSQYLLFLLRANSYGSMYEFKISCNRCGFDFKHEVQIPDDFEVVYLDDGSSEPFYVELPLSGHRVGFRLLRNRDTLDISRYSDKRMKKQVTQEDPSYTYRIAKSIVEIDGEDVSQPLHQSQKMRFIDELIGADSITLQNAMDDHDCGLNPMIETLCVKCRNLIEQRIPFTREFFRPERVRGLRST